MKQSSPLSAQSDPIEDNHIAGDDHQHGSAAERPRQPDFYLITCEHAGNRVPTELRPLFKRDKAMLYTHRGYDPGALTLTREIAAALHAPYLQSTISRLVVDLNRSIGHPRLHAEVIQSELSSEAQQKIIERHYLPYRRKAEALIAQAIVQGRRVIHISCHSFTPALNGKVRNADIGLLFDPACPGETAFCRDWQTALSARRPDCTTRRNYPYVGTSDAFTSYLRRHFPVEAYLGMEIEINQKHVFIGGRHWRGLRAAVVETLCATLETMAERRV